jgi:diadenosine tetraphosphatase ApaH/serine/threonine PP2A family protein phosphatase
MERRAPALDKKGVSVLVTVELGYTPSESACGGSMKTTRLAAFGGSYGNVPAFEACLADAEACGADLKAFLGDAIGCCGHSEEVLALVGRTCEVLVAGNHEQQAAAGAETCGCGYSSPDDEAVSCEAFQLATSALGDASRAWLATWPSAAVVEAPGGRVLLCHGSPGRTSEFLYECELDDLRLEAWLDRFDVRGFVCTHSGLPWVRRLRGGRFAVNCGVVGKPDHDGDPAVHYALIECPASGDPRLEIRRVTYDHQAWGDQMERAGIAKVFVDPVRTGVWTTGVASLPPAERHRPLRSGVRPASPGWQPEFLDPAAFQRVLGAACELRLLHRGESAQVQSLFDPAFPFFSAFRLANSVHAHIKVDDVSALPHAAIMRLDTKPENAREGYVKYSFAGGINLIFSSIPIAEDDLLPGQAPPKPFLDHMGIDLRREIGIVRAAFDDVPLIASRAGWLEEPQGGAGRAVSCCHAHVAAKHWVYPPDDDERWRRPIEMAFGPLRITAEMSGCDLRPIDPRHPGAPHARAACARLPS